MRKRRWTGRLGTLSWYKTRDGEPIDSLVLEVELSREPGRFVDVVVPRQQAFQLARYIEGHR